MKIKESTYWNGLVSSLALTWMNICVHTYQPGNLNELKIIFLEELAKIPTGGCLKPMVGGWFCKERYFPKCIRFCFIPLYERNLIPFVFWIAGWLTSSKQKMKIYKMYKDKQSHYINESFKNEKYMSFQQDSNPIHTINVTNGVWNKKNVLFTIVSINPVCGAILR